MKAAIFTDDRNLINYSGEYITFISNQMLIETDIDYFGKADLNDKELPISEYDLLYIDLEETDYQDVILEFTDRVPADRMPFVVFISSDNRYMEGMGGNKSIAFINKPFMIRPFETIFRNVLAQIEADNGFFEYSLNRKLETLRIKDIVYFESVGRKIHIQKGDGSSYFFYGKLDEIEERLINDLECDCFLRNHKSYLVNYNWIYRSSKTEITLLNGQSLPISRSYQGILAN